MHVFACLYTNISKILCKLVNWMQRDCQIREEFPEHQSYVQKLSCRDRAVMNNQIDYSEIAQSKRGARTVLSCEQARDIFMSKPSPSTNSRYHAKKLSELYGVSPKTIRDIWIGRTWYRETCFLDPTIPACTERLKKRPGRPIGAKDMKPRSKKHSANFQAKNRSSYKQSLSAHIEGPVPSFQLTTHNDCIPAVKEVQGPSISAATGLLRISRHSLVDNKIFSCRTCTNPIDWAAYLSDKFGDSSQFTDPFHDDWAFWPKENATQ